MKRPTHKNAEDEQLEKLKTLAEEHETAAKLLVRRDLELTEANRKLEELDKIKSEFVSIVAHQLRTPLSAIKWTLKMVLDGDLGAINEEQKNFLQKGYKSNEHLIRLINDMLNVSRIDAGKFQYSFYLTNLEEIMQDIIQEYRDAAQRKNISIEYVRPKNQVPLLYIDVEKMRLAIQNIIENSIKYTEKGSIQVHIKVKQNDVVVSMKDTGIGIPPGEQKNIFSKFFRGTNALKKETEGSGLGLFIVKNIIEKHSGKIWFTSASNDGTTFFFSLPIPKK